MEQKREMCPICGLYPVNGRAVEFMYRGMEVKTFCFLHRCVECYKRFWIGRFEDLVASFIEISDDGKMKVRWSELLLKIDEEIGHDFMDEAYMLLVDLGILTFDEVLSSHGGAWTIMDTADTHMGPCFGGVPLYFVHQEDAVIYALIEYGNAVYSWRLAHIDQIIDGKDLV